MMGIRNNIKSDKQKFEFDQLLFFKDRLLHKMNRAINTYNDNCQWIGYNISEIKSADLKIYTVIQKFRGLCKATISKNKILGIRAKLDEIDENFAEHGYGYENWKWEIENKLNYRILTANRNSEQIEKQIKENSKRIQEEIIADINALIDIYKGENKGSNLKNGLKITGASTTDRSVSCYVSSKDFTNIVITIYLDCNGCVLAYQKSVIVENDEKDTRLGFPMSEATFYTPNQNKSININDYPNYYIFFVAQLEKAKENFASVMDVNIEKNKSTSLPNGAIAVTYSRNGSEKACFEGDFKNKEMGQLNKNRFKHNNDVIACSNRAHAFELEEGKLKTQKEYLGNYTEIYRKVY